ncbi:MAG: sulfite oxidase-like oxidoreductase [Alphaproteobacteria bacterium]|nr:MAG: sulfite oxidase-like oxidoreductase [Alphaproteobacteria bacterium]
MSDEISILGKLKEKLIQRKQEWARDGRLLTGNQTMEDRELRLPRGQRLVTDWPVLDLGIQPDVPTAAWSLTVDGLVENPLTWDWDQYMAQPQFEDVSDIHCVTAWSRYDNLWQGVSTRHIIDLVKPKTEANHIILHGFDGYTTNVTLAAFAADDALIAHSWEGEKLTRQHGGPVRAIIPQYYLWKSAKWVSRLEFVDADQPGFWEVRGYHNEGDPWKEERYSF